MANKKILVVDDEQSITKLLKLVLEKTGRYEVSCENDGKKAVRTALSVRPDLLILDVNMPDVNGGQIAASVKADPLLQDVPIIFLTGNVSSDESDAGMTIGGHPAMAKPIDLEKLLSRVQQSLP